jgi:hypothetical protein
MVRVLLCLLAVGLFEMTFVMGDKMSVYLIHMTPLLATLTAVVLASAMSRAPWARWAALAVVSTLIAVQAGGFLYQIGQNTYANRYLPAVAAIRAYSSPGDPIIGSSAFFWTLRDERRISDDFRLGLYTHLQPKLIVTSPFYRAVETGVTGERGQYFQRTLSLYSKIIFDGEYVVHAKP